jgi:hypothetical protein
LPPPPPTTPFLELTKLARFSSVCNILVVLYKRLMA